MHITKSWITQGGHNSFEGDMGLAGTYYGTKATQLHDLRTTLASRITTPVWEGKTKDAALEWAGRLGGFSYALGDDFDAAAKTLADLGTCIGGEGRTIATAIQGLPADWTVSEELQVSDQDGNPATDVQQVIDQAKTNMQTGLNTAVASLQSIFSHAVADTPATALINQRDKRLIVQGQMPLPADGEDLKTFWAQLTRDEKLQIFAHHPDIGNHAGVPMAERSAFNVQRLMDMLRSGNLSDDERRRLIAVLNAINPNDGRGIGADRHPPILLTYLDERNHAAVLVGNPDTARQVATLVPGTGADLEDMGEYTQRAQRLQLAAMKAGGLSSEDVSVTTWMGYDRPPYLWDAASESWARSGAQALDDWQTGLRVTHQGDPAYQTVIGHSYGTTEIGAAATNGHHLDANAVALVASPGAFADSAAGLSLDDHARVFTARAAGDPIGLPLLRSHFGPDPTGWPDALRFNTDSGGHSSYFDPGNPALDNLGRIIAGMDGTNGVQPAGR